MTDERAYLIALLVLADHPELIDRWASGSKQINPSVVHFGRH